MRLSRRPREWFGAALVWRLARMIAVLLLTAPGAALADEATPKPASTHGDDQYPHIELDVRAADGSVQTLRGRLLVDMGGGQLMVEESTSAIYIVPGVDPAARRSIDEPFAYLSDEQMADFLRQQMGASFRVVQTEHYLLCSAATPLYTEYCGKLLERVHDQFYQFFADRGLTLQPLRGRLPVIMLAGKDALQQFASQQHPETDFSETPGYYSLRHNQMLIGGAVASRPFRRATDVAREMREHVREVETIVHEAVHQLAYNSGLQVRYADNPMWLSEGLAVYFESTSGRSSLGWSRPGEVSRLHLPTLKPARPLNRMPYALSELAVSPQGFAQQDLMAASYAESWAIVHYLAVRRKEALIRLLQAYQQAAPGISLGAQRHTQLLEDALGEPLAEGEDSVLRYVRRLRRPR